MFLSIRMDTLFPIEPIFPEGFDYYSDFITDQEERSLYQEIQKIELHTFNFQGYEAKRKVASFGYDYSFDKKSLSKGKDIPSVFHPLINKVALKLDIDQEHIAELLVTEYPVGSVINWHRDAFPFEIIAGISLLADCTFRLRPHDKEKQGRGSMILFPVARRSLYIMKGPARMNWQHSIAPVKAVRYSITLRTLKKK
jgi:alkylated DNA repair dioxygenase AlkB